jgi:hypothetical protein
MDVVLSFSQKESKRTFYIGLVYMYVDWLQCHTLTATVPSQHPHSLQLPSAETQIACEFSEDYYSPAWVSSFCTGRACSLPLFLQRWIWVSGISP